MPFDPELNILARPEADQQRMWLDVVTTRWSSGGKTKGWHALGAAGDGRGEGRALCVMWVKGMSFEMFGV